MTLYVLKGTILVEVDIDYSRCYKAKELYCEEDIGMPCWSVNAECYAFASICKKSSWS